MTVTPPDARCPLCGASNTALVYDLTALDFPFAVPGLVLRCRSCPMWFKLLSDPGGLPTAYIGESGQDDVAAAYLFSEAARAQFRQALAHIDRGAHGARPRLLDIGAAQGVLLEEAARMGFDAEGIDHNQSNVRDARAKGLTVRLAAAEDLEEREAFDVVTMMDFIEHVLDPVHVLHRAHRALKPGGELVVYTPNHRSAVVTLAKWLYRIGIRYPVQEIFGRNHVSFFDDRSLPLALENAGFHVSARYMSRYDPSRPGQAVSPVNLAAMRGAEWLGTPFGRVFRMLVYARRPGGD